MALYRNFFIYESLAGNKICMKVTRGVCVWITRSEIMREIFSSSKLRVFDKIKSLMFMSNSYFAYFFLSSYREINKKFMKIMFDL